MIMRWVNRAMWLVLAAMIAWQFGVPVVVLERASEWDVQPNRVSAHVEGIKLRRCDYISGSEAGYVRHGLRWHESQFRYEGDPSPGNTRPTGFQSFGTWLWSEVGTRPNAVMLRVNHFCNGSIVTTEMGPFTVPP